MDVARPAEPAAAFVPGWVSPWRQMGYALPYSLSNDEAMSRTITTCIAHGLTMVTANTRELARLPGLDVELWDDPR